MSENSSSGMTTWGLLGVVFVTLKLCGVIDWSWVWVTAPFWGGIVITFGFLAMVFVIGLLSVGMVGILAAIEKMKK